MTEMTTVETPHCMRCGKSSTLTLPVEGFNAWRAGALIQRALPMLSADERELLITGYHSTCWDADFPEEEDDKCSHVWQSMEEDNVHWIGCTKCGIDSGQHELNQRMRQRRL